MTVVRVRNTDIAQVAPGEWCATGPLAEVMEVLDAARRHGPVTSTRPQPAGRGLVLVNFRQGVPQRQRAAPPRPAAQRQPAPPPPAAKPRRTVLGAPVWAWILGAGAAAGVAFAIAVWLVLSWVAAHTAELAGAGGGLLGLAAVVLLLYALAGGGGGSGHCSGPGTGH